MNQVNEWVQTISNKILAAVFWVVVLLITAYNEALVPHFDTIFWGSTLLAGIIAGFEGIVDALDKRNENNE